MRHRPGAAPAPAYQGRPLPRPDEEIVDQGLAFDVRTLLGRRQLLRAFGIGAAAAGLAACSPEAGSNTGPDARAGSSAGSSAGPSAGSSTGPSASATAGTPIGEIPDETAGPFPGDGSNGPDVLEQSGVVRADIRSSLGGAGGTAGGVPMTLDLTIRDLARGGAPFTGAAVYVWHCDREGRYSMYSDGVTGENYLRGVQIADGSGRVRFTSVFPGCYEGRWPHVHFEVYPGRADITDAAKAVATSQVALPQDACTAVYATRGYESSVTSLARLSLRDDSVFGDDGGASQLATVTGDLASGPVVSLTVGVDTTTAATGGRAPGRR